MHDDRALVEDRLEHLIERLEERTHRVVAELDVEAWRAPGEPVSLDEARLGEYRPLARGTWWGPAWSTWWLRVTGRVPEGARDERVEARVDLGFVGDWAGNQSEGMAWTTDGVPLKGVNPRNRTVPLTFGALARARACEGAPLVGEDGRVELLVEAAANPDLTHHMNSVTRQGDRETASDEPVWQFRGADLVVRNDDVWHLLLDVQVLDGLMRELPADDTHRAVLLRGLERAADVLDEHGIDEGAARARELLAPLLASGANTSAQLMTAVGHAHIDSAWLWPIRETKRKVVRTFANVVALAEQYPDLHFACTSMQHYAWLQEASPELFDRVRVLIERGQWHVMGGTWVEPDTNLPGGESLVRQFLVGLRWAERELGVRPTCLWLPDSFGYTAALPQIARLAGMDWFVTQKLNWNQTNQLPHHTFWWEGVDGTRIWTHFPPVDCYDSVVSAKEVTFAARNFKEKGVARHSLLPFGYGDGGGGPVPEMLERARRFRDLEDAPALRLRSPEDFHADAVAEYPEPPVWAGELYLEFHRGVYTSNVALKQGNRRTEAWLALVEWLAVLAERRGDAAPLAELERLWQRMLLLQFHDILPGASIAWVNREARAEYEQLHAELAALAERLTAQLRDGTDGISVLNATPITRREVVDVDGQARLVAVPGWGAAPLDRAAVDAEHPVRVTEADGRIVLDNGLVRVTVDADGLVASLVDVAHDRELVLPGRRCNELWLHPDRPSSFDAWELQHQYRRGGGPVAGLEGIEIVERGDLRSAVEVRRRFGDSTVVQRIALDADTTTVDLAIDVDWQERARVLKVAMPLAVRAMHADAEIQFAHVSRPIAPNTSWDAARFETSGHRWLLLDEPGLAVAIVNDSSHGHDVRPAGGDAQTPTRGVDARLTLLRSPQAPDPDADRGRHVLRYGIVVDASVESATAAGHRLHQPLRPVEGRVAVAGPTLGARSEGAFAVLDTVKPAADGSGDLVVRLHEARGTHSRVALRLPWAATAVTETDLLEKPLPEPTQTLPGRADVGDDLVLDLHPFQLLTLRITAA